MILMVNNVKPSKHTNTNRKVNNIVWKVIRVEVFKTNVQNKLDAALLVKKISNKFQDLKINFDLEDCDNILRVEGNHFCSNSIKEFMKICGYSCEVLEE